MKAFLFRSRRRVLLGSASWSWPLQHIFILIFERLLYCNHVLSLARRRRPDTTTAYRYKSITKIQIMTGPLTYSRSLLLLGRGVGIAPLLVICWSLLYSKEGSLVAQSGRRVFRQVPDLVVLTHHWFERMYFYIALGLWSVHGLSVDFHLHDRNFSLEISDILPCGVNRSRSRCRSILCWFLVF